MGRPKTFCREEALDKATDLFWERGYESTSIQELLDHLGIGRASLYDTFGSKHEMYCEVMRRYRERLEQYLAPLESADSPRAAIRGFFQGVVEAQAREESKGCLMLKSAVMTSSQDEASRQMVLEFTARMDQAFLTALRRAEELGEILPGKDLPRLASFLTHSVSGLTVSGCVRRCPDALSKLAETALSVLD